MAMAPPPAQYTFQYQQCPSPHATDVHLHMRRLKQALTCCICLRLLKQASCLPCMHHFCGSCLPHTLVEMAACPKCKSPAALRQARPSPDIDNLVNVYQSLKIAIGHKYGLPMLHDIRSSSLNPQNGTQEDNHVELKKPISQGDFTSEQMMHISKGNLSAVAVDAIQVHKKTDRLATSVIESQYRGILTASKRVQPPCPLSGNADEMQEGKEGCTPKLLGVDFKRKDEGANIPSASTFAEHGNNLSDVKSEKMQEAPMSFKDVETENHVRLNNPSCNHNVLKEMKGHCDDSAKCLHFQAQSFHYQLDPTVTNKQESLNTPQTQVRMETSSVATALLDCGMESNNVNMLEARTVFNSYGNGAKPEGAQDIKFNTNKDVKQELENDGSNTYQEKCAFCQTSDTLVAGPMIHYKEGIPVKVGRKSASYCSVHKTCAEWAPNVYYEDDVPKNLPQEIARGKKIKCSDCGLKGAVLGCCVKRCRKSFHYPCAHALSCRWDEVNFLVLCPDHVSSRFPDEDAQKRRKTMIEQKSSTTDPSVKELMNDMMAVKNAQTEILQRIPTIESCTERSTKLLPTSAASKWVLCGSGLNAKANELVACFLRHTGAEFSKNWSPYVTHLIIGTDEKGAARRTLKYLMATLGGKWILKPDWLAVSIDAGRPLNEEPYEVNLDIHGMIGGPRHGRLMAASKAPLLFKGLKFYFLGMYAESYKTDLQDLITAAGGVLLAEKPCIGEDGAGGAASWSVVIYSRDFYPDANADNLEEVIQCRRSEAKVMAAQVGAKVAGHTWILDSIAAFGVQPFE